MTDTSIHQPWHAIPSERIADGINRQMVNMSAAPVVSAQYDANNRRFIKCHSA